MLARMLADPVTTPRKQARVVALVLPVQTLRRWVCCNLPRDGEQMAEGSTGIIGCGCLRLEEPEAPLDRWRH